ncbi:MAG: TlpA disulfide reductase family protein [Bacteroidota bacterium]
MKRRFYFGISTLLLSIFSCTTAQLDPASFESVPASAATSATSAAAPVVNITAIISGTGGQLGVYRFDGIGFKNVQQIPATQGDTFLVQLPQGEADVYYLGLEKKQKLPVVVGPEDQFEITADARTIRKAIFINSEWNRQYDALIKRIMANKREMQSIGQQIQRSANNDDALEQLRLKIKKVDQRRAQQVTDLEKEYPLLAKLAAIDNYQSFTSAPKGHANELEHYVNEFFSGADLSDPIYNKITYVFEAFRDFGNTLALINMPQEKVNAALDLQLQQIPDNSLTYKYALGGITLALQGRNHPSFIDYGKRFYQKYQDESAPYIQQLGRQVNSAQSLMIGAVAPDFTQRTPEGEEFSLSDLRGKVVLLDFWASWCGPCRRENPHVVKLYKKYQEKGFDILGVSLDRQKDRWLAAIDKDKLTWHHVSDLKGWQNEVAGSYSVRSIPHTLLLDQDGKIIARNLRGGQLDAKLKEIFGF